MATDEMQQPSARFMQAATAAPGKISVPLSIDADVLRYFQADNQPGNWQEHINGILRFYMETTEAMEADAEAVAHMNAQPEPGMTP